jgi:predicted amidophosphoribosyltransferase
MAAMNPQVIAGRWMKGVALDVHTIRSTYMGVDEIGHDVFDTIRSELGELLVRLKYRGDQGAAPEIIATAVTFLEPHRHKIDRIVPVPSSTVRVVQPVIILANGIGSALGIPVDDCITLTRAATQLKDIADPDRRREALAGLHAVDRAHTEAANILLLDDLFRSGATMNAVTDVLMGQGRAASVRAFTITRTRSNQ